MASCLSSPAQGRSPAKSCDTGRAQGVRSKREEEQVRTTTDCREFFCKAENVGPSFGSFFDTNEETPSKTSRACVEERNEHLHNLPSCLTIVLSWAASFGRGCGQRAVNSRRQGTQDKKIANRPPHYMQDQPSWSPDHAHMSCTRKRQETKHAHGPSHRTQNISHHHHDLPPSLGAQRVYKHMTHGGSKSFVLHDNNVKQTLTFALHTS